MESSSRAPREIRSPNGESSRGENSFRRKALCLALFLIFASSLLNALFGDRGLIELRRAQRDLQALEQEIAALEAENQQLLEEVRSLKTSPLAIERLAREQLGLVGPNEVILLIRK